MDIEILQYAQNVAKSHHSVHEMWHYLEMLKSVHSKFLNSSK